MRQVLPATVEAKDQVSSNLSTLPVKAISWQVSVNCKPGESATVSDPPQAPKQ